ncbi:hypothetical protein HYR69_09330, partial [Candidatus Sumerlaeota bacterium]|nr:hypothetical protein [Candidatus Sumerlaeota bacterium]
YNRVAPHRTEGFGGFYGVVDNIEPLTEGMIAGALAEARAESEKLKSAAPALDSILTELRAALDYRVARAEWPPDFRYVPIEKVLPTRGFLLQLISKLRRE